MPSRGARSGLLKKPTLRRSADHAYETLIADHGSTILSQSLGVTSFDCENDPPLALLDDDCSLSSKSTHDSFYQLSMNTVEMPACRGPSLLTSKASSDAGELKTADAPGHLEVVRITSSEEKESAKAANRPQAIVYVPNMDGREEKDGMASRNNSSDQVYFPEKPQNFSLQASPVRKEETTLNSLDCSFDVNLKSIDADNNGSKLTSFDQSFERRDAPKSTEVSSPSCDPEEDASPLASSGSMVLEKSASSKRPSDANAANDFVRLLEELTGRLSSLERIVRRLDANMPVSQSNHMKVSDTTQSDQTVDYQAHDMAFIIEGTEILQISSLKEDIPSPRDWEDAGLANKKFNGGFSLKRLFGSRLFRMKSKRMSSF